MKSFCKCGKELTSNNLDKHAYCHDRPNLINELALEMIEMRKGVHCAGCGVEAWPIRECPGLEP